MEYKEQRRYESILVCSGSAVIIFGLWSIVRLIMFRFLDYSAFASFITKENVLHRKTLEWIVLGIVLLCLMIDLLLRIYIGRRAIQEGKGNKVSIRYIIVTILYFSISFVSDMKALFFSKSTETNFTNLSSAAISLISSVAFIMVVYGALQLRRIKRR